MKTIAVLGLKGGTGKTTTSLALAYALADRFKEPFAVLLHDLDSQSSATLACGLEPSPSPLAEPPVEAAGIFHLRCGGRSLAGEPIHAFRRALDEPAEYVYRVLDVPPSLGPGLFAAIEVADLVVVPVSPNGLELPSLWDAVELVEPGADHLRVALVRTHPRRAITEQVREAIEQSLPGRLFRTEVPEDVRVAEAPTHGIPLLQFAPSCRAAVAYRELAREVEDALQEDA